MKYGYARVSTTHQDLLSQLEKLEKEVCKQIFKGKFTGTDRDRSEFNIVIDILKKDDILVVTKLDRFARSTLGGINTIKELFERGIKVHVLNMGLVEDTPTARPIFSIMLAFADMIVERNQEGQAIARLSPDFKEGRPRKYTKKQIDHALRLKESNSFKQVEQLTGISKSTIIRAMRRSGQNGKL